MSIPISTELLVSPAEQATGYREMFRQLQSWLAEITGFHAVSLQPNAGAQGEYAGLLVIRAYHEARGEGERRGCARSARRGPAGSGP